MKCEPLKRLARWAICMIAAASFIAVQPETMRKSCNQPAANMPALNNLQVYRGTIVRPCFALYDVPGQGTRASSAQYCRSSWGWSRRKRAKGSQLPDRTPFLNSGNAPVPPYPKSASRVASSQATKKRQPRHQPPKTVLPLDRCTTVKYTSGATRSPLLYEQT